MFRNSASPSTALTKTARALVVLAVFAAPACGSSAPEQAVPIVQLEQPTKSTAASAPAAEAAAELEPAIREARSQDDNPLPVDLTPTGDAPVALPELVAWTPTVEAFIGSWETLNSVNERFPLVGPRRDEWPVDGLTMWTVLTGRDSSIAMLADDETGEIRQIAAMASVETLATDPHEHRIFSWVVAISSGSFSEIFGSSVLLQTDSPGGYDLGGISICTSRVDAGGTPTAALHLNWQGPSNC